MTTRGSLARGLGKETFQGRVQKWVRKLSPVGGGQGAGRLKFLRWVPTGEKSAAVEGPRWSHIVPVKGMESKTPLSPQQRRATQAAPTLRLKLKLGASEAQLSVPGSEDEDASRLTSALDTSGPAASAATRAGAVTEAGQEALSPRLHRDARHPPCAADLLAGMAASAPQLPVAPPAHPAAVPTAQPMHAQSAPPLRSLSGAGTSDCHAGSAAAELAAACQRNDLPGGADLSGGGVGRVGSGELRAPPGGAALAPPAALEEGLGSGFDGGAPSAVHSALCGTEGAQGTEEAGPGPSSAAAAEALREHGIGHVAPSAGDARPGVMVVGRAGKKRGREGDGREPVGDLPDAGARGLVSLPGDAAASAAKRDRMGEGNGGAAPSSGLGSSQSQLPDLKAGGGPTSPA